MALVFPVVEGTIDVLGFERHRFTKSSADIIPLYRAVSYGIGSRHVLVNAQEAAAVRIAAGGEDAANEETLTRTACMYFRSERKFYVAIGSSPGRSGNPVLASARRAVDAGDPYGSWPQYLDSPLVRPFLRRAERDDSIFAVPPDGRLELRLADRRDGSSQYSRHGLVRAQLGTVASAYNNWLRDERLHETGVIIFSNHSELRSLGVRGNNAQLRACRIGGPLEINTLFLTNLPAEYGFARAMRRVPR